MKEWEKKKLEEVRNDEAESEESMDQMERVEEKEYSEIVKSSTGHVAERDRNGEGIGSDGEAGPDLTLSPILELVHLFERRLQHSPYRC